MKIELPNEIWHKIFVYHRKNIKEIAKQKKAELNRELVNSFGQTFFDMEIKNIELLYTQDSNLHYYCPWIYVWQPKKYDRLFNRIHYVLKPFIRFKMRFDYHGYLDITCAELYDLFCKNKSYFKNLDNKYNNNMK